jgi:putative membrane protein
MAPRSDLKIRQQLPQVLLALFSLAWLFLAIRPVDRSTWLFENLPVFAAIPVLIYTYRRFRFSNSSYVFMAAFLILHTIGAHYTYSEMPVGNWFRDHWGLARNHYDRLLHLFFGLLITFPFWEYVHRRLGLSARVSALIAIHAILAWSMLYELLEALVAHLVSPALGTAYNGTQGDEWDPQKDMFLALLGSLLAVLFLAIWRAHNANKPRRSAKSREASLAEVK